jgi:hypothetical protein
VVDRPRRVHEVAEYLRITWRSVQAIEERVVTELAGPTDLLSGLRRIGIDKISYRKGQRYLLVTWNHASGWIFALGRHHELRGPVGVFVIIEEKWPVLGRHERAAEWLRMWSDLGRAPRTIDAYARGLAEYLCCVSVVVSTR